MTLKNTTLAAAATLIALNAFAAETATEAPTVATTTPATTTTDTASLRAELDNLRQQLAIIERKAELKDEAAATKAKETGVFNFDENGFKATSADKNFQLRIRGLVQTDYRTYFDDGAKSTDTFLLRRARPIVEATIGKDYDAVLVPEFGGSYGIGASSSSVPAPTILDAYLNAKIYSEAVQLRIGKFKSPLGLDVSQEDPARPLLESAFPTYLVPNRDIGIQLHGKIDNGLIRYQVGIFNGTPDGSISTGNDYSDNKDIAARITVQPFVNSSEYLLNGLGVGFATDYGSKVGTAGGSSTGLTGGYKTDGAQGFFTYGNTVRANGHQQHFVPQAYWYIGPFSILAEYVASETEVSGANATHSDNIVNQAWQVTGGWVLTGENASFTGVAPDNPVTSGGYGAWEIVARASQLYIDNTVFDRGYASGATPGTPGTYAAARSANASGAKSYAAGVNWYLSKNLRVSADYTHTDFDAVNPTSALLRNGENAVLVRAQVSF